MKAGIEAVTAVCSAPQDSDSFYLFFDFWLHTDNFSVRGERKFPLLTTFFMVISAVNFALHFSAWKHRSLRHYWEDPELRFYLSILLVISFFCTIVLELTGTFTGVEALRHAVFEVVSIATTTGFATADFAHWPTMLPFLLFIAAFAGGCAGSTGGGMKVIRIMLLYRQAVREIHRLIISHAVTCVVSINSDIYIIEVIICINYIRVENCN